MKLPIEQPIPSSESFGPAFDSEFQTFIEAVSQRMTESLDGMVRDGFYTQAERDQKFAMRMAEFTQSNKRTDKAQSLLNNFYLWLPGGYYRSPTRDNEKKTEIVSDIDAILHEMSAAITADEILSAMRDTNSALSKDSAYELLVKIFLKLREKGYAQKELAQ